MLHELRKPREALHEILAESHRMGGGEADTLDSVDGVERLQELHEGTLAIHLGEFVASVEIDDLAEQRHLLDPPVGEGSGFLDDFRDRAAAFGSARRRDDAEGAVHVASLHDRDERGGGLLLRGEMLADGVLRTLLGGDVDDRGHRNDASAQFGCILAGKGLLTTAERFLHMVGDTVKLLGPHHEVDMG